MPLILLNFNLVSIPKILKLLCLVLMLHIFLYVLTVPQQYLYELNSIGREFLMLLFAVYIGVPFVNKRGSFILFIFVVILLLIDFLQSIEFSVFRNFSMQQYYDNINIELYLPRYVYYIDHISFTPLVVFLVIMVFVGLRCNPANYISKAIYFLLIFLVQSRTYIVHVGLNLLYKTKIYLVLIMMLFFVMSFLAIDYKIDYVDDYRILSVLSEEGYFILLNDLDMRIQNWSVWLNLIFEKNYYFGIGAYGLSNKAEYVNLDVYAIDNIFLREVVRYGILGVVKLIIYAFIFMQSCKKPRDEEYFHFFLFVRYILIASIVNDLISDVIVRMCFYVSVVVLYTVPLATVERKAKY